MIGNPFLLFASERRETQTLLDSLSELPGGEMRFLLFGFCTDMIIGFYFQELSSTGARRCDWNYLHFRSWLFIRQGKGNEILRADFINGNRMNTGMGLWKIKFRNFARFRIVESFAQGLVPSSRIQWRRIAHESLNISKLRRQKKSETKFLMI